MKGCVSNINFVSFSDYDERYSCNSPNHFGLSDIHSDWSMHSHNSSGIVKDIL